MFVWNAITIVNSSEKIQIGRKINKIFRFVQEKSKKSSKKTTFFAHTRIIIRYIKKFLVSLQTDFLSQMDASQSSYGGRCRPKKHGQRSRKELFRH